MRNLPINRTPRHNLIINAVADFYGEGISEIERSESKGVALYIMGRKRGLVLNENQKEVISYVKQNLGDKIYTDSLIET